MRSDNRWVKLAKFIPWEEFEADYAKTLASRDKGPPAMSVRVALGTLMIKEQLGTSDEETVEQISENPYLQYFKQNRIDDRIVDISQPHVRPIKRGKAKASTAFGAEISVSLADGYTFLDHLDWDNFNESLDLKPQIKAYHKRFGCYPESVHADKIYRTRDNIKYCKSHHIRLSGPPLGRPPKKKELQKQLRKQIRQDELDRIPIEGKFGQGKRRFSLSKIMCKLAQTSASAIAIAFLVLNLEKWAVGRSFLSLFIARFRLLWANWRS